MRLWKCFTAKSFSPTLDSTGNSGRETDVSLFLVDLKAGGVTAKPLQNVDPSRQQAELSTEEVKRVISDIAEMGVLDYAKIDVAEQLANDGKVAEEFDKKMFVEKAIAAE